MVGECVFWGEGGMGELIVGGGGLGETRWKISPDFRSPEVGITGNVNQCQ